MESDPIYTGTIGGTVVVLFVITGMLVRLWFNYRKSIQKLENDDKQNDLDYQLKVRVAIIKEHESIRNSYLEQCDKIKTELKTEIVEMRAIIHSLVELNSKITVENAELKTKLEGITQVVNIFSKIEELNKSIGELIQTIKLKQSN